MQKKFAMTIIFIKYEVWKYYLIWPSALRARSSMMTSNQEFKEVNRMLRSTALISEEAFASKTYNKLKQIRAIVFEAQNLKKLADETQHPPKPAMTFYFTWHSYPFLLLF